MLLARTIFLRVCSLPGQGGFLVEPQDNKGFAERIIHILQNPDEAKTVGEKAKEKVRKEFLITRLLSDYLDMLNSIVNA